VLGFSNKSAIHKTFKEIMNGPFERMNRDSLSRFITNNKLDLQNIKTNYKGQPMPDANWALKESGLWEAFIQRYQDNLRDLKKVQEVITKDFGPINNKFNAYGKEIVSSGRVGTRLSDFAQYEVNPLVKEMLDSKVSIDEFSKYLQNRYAPERNKIINEKNQSPSVRDQGSGIHTDDAKQYMQDLDADRKKVLEKLANRVDAIVRETQDILVKSGDETQATIDQWRRESPHYVPLKRDETELDFVIDKGGIGGSRGLGAKGNFGRQALGSTKTVVDILENVMLQRERAESRAENIRIGNALYGLAITHPNPNFWMPINPRAVKNKAKLLEQMEAMGLDLEFAENLLAEPRTARLTKTKDEEGKEMRTVTYQVDRNYRQAKNVFPTRINGEDVFVLFNPKSVEATRLVDALKDNDPETIGLIVGTASSFTRWFTSVNSQYNLVFGLWNFWNDSQGAWLKLSSTPLAGKQRLFEKNLVPALKTIGKELRRQRNATEKPGKSSDENVEYFRRMRAAGGMTGMRDTMLKAKVKFDLKNPVWGQKVTFEEEHLLERQINALQHGPAMKKAIFVADMISDINDTLENATRLAAFKVAVMPESEGGLGLSDEEGAIIAKTLTINFNKHGARTKNIRGLYGFFNAGVQNTASVAATLGGPAGRTIIKGGLLLGVVQAMLLLTFGFDDDDPPEFVKNKGFVIPLGNKNYTAWSLPGGYRAIPNMGRLLTEGMLIATGAMKSNHGLGAKALDAAGVLVDAVNPFGNAGSILQAAAPTAVDTIVALTENKDSFGRPIYKEDTNLKQTPGWKRTRDSARTLSKGMSYMLNYVTSGGEPHDKGFISPTGDEIDYTINQIIGGAGREVEKAFLAGANLFQGEKTPIHKIPVVNRLYGEIDTPEAASARFYDNISMLAKHKGIIEGRAQEGQDVQGYMKKHPESQLSFAAEEIENEVSNINATIHKVKMLPSTKENKETVKRLEEGRTLLMTNFNKAVSKSHK